MPCFQPYPSQHCSLTFWLLVQASSNQTRSLWAPQHTSLEKLQGLFMAPGLCTGPHKEDPLELGSHS